MKRFHLALMLFAAAPCCSTLPAHSQALDSNYARDPGQPIDQQYTDKILKYTTDKSFVSPLVDYLPASKTVPTPEKVLGDVSGAPNMLPYAEDVYKYFRMLEASSPRVKVCSIGTSEEGREMIVVAIADPELLAAAKENRRAWRTRRSPHHRHGRRQGPHPYRQILAGVLLTGTIHSTETGAPTA